MFQYDSIDDDAPVNDEISPLEEEILTLLLILSAPDPAEDS